MTCKQVQHLLPDYVRGELSDEEMSLVAQHLHECKDCPKELASLQQLYNRLDAMEIEEPREEYWQTFVPRVHERIEARSKRRVPGWVPRFAYGLAAIAAVIVALEVLLPRNGQVEPQMAVTQNDLRLLLEEMSDGEFQQIPTEDVWTANNLSTLEGDADVLKELIDTSSVGFVESDTENLIAAYLTDRQVEVILAYLDQQQFIH